MQKKQMIIVILTIFLIALVLIEQSFSEISKVEGRIQNLISQFKDSEGDVRLSAIEKLVKIGKPAVKPLIKALKDSNSNVRSSVTIVLGKIGDKRAVRPLIGVLHDRDKFTRRGAAISLGMIGEERAVGPLIRLLESELVTLTNDHNDQHIETARYAAKALEMITEKHFGFNYMEWKRWWREKKMNSNQTLRFS